MESVHIQTKDIASNAIFAPTSLQEGFQEHLIKKSGNVKSCCDVAPSTKDEIKEYLDSINQLVVENDLGNGNVVEMDGDEDHDVQALDKLNNNAMGKGKQVENVDIGPQGKKPRMLHALNKYHKLVARVYSIKANQSA